MGDGLSVGDLSGPTGCPCARGAIDEREVRLPAMKALS